MDTQDSNLTDDTTENNNSDEETTVRANDVSITNVTTSALTTAPGPDSEPTPTTGSNSNITIENSAIVGNEGVHGDTTNDGGILSTGNIMPTTRSASATAAPDSDRTNSSSITSISTGNGGGNGDTKNEATKSNVSFGSVHVHEHRMTLGTNPDVSYGVPVELAWSADASDDFATIEDYERKAHPDLLSPVTNSAVFSATTTTSTDVLPPVSSHRVVHRLAAAERDEIARLHHSRESIVRVKQEVQTIQEQRHDSKRDKEAIHIVQEIRRQRLVDTQTTATDNTNKPNMGRDNNDNNNNKKNNANTNTTTKKSWWSHCCP